MRGKIFYLNISGLLAVLALSGHLRVEAATTTTYSTSTNVTTVTHTSSSTATSTSIDPMAASSAMATLAQVCGVHNTLKADDGPCPKEFPFFKKKQSCVDACEKATEGAIWAKLVCQDHAAVDQQLYAQGQKQAQEAANNTEQKQNSNETSNAQNMTAGKQTQQQRLANAKAMESVFTICVLLGVKCDQEGGNGVPVDLSCQNALQALNQMEAALANSADHMNAKNDKSSTYAETLTELQVSRLTSSTPADAKIDTVTASTNSIGTAAASNSALTIPGVDQVDMSMAKDGADPNSGASGAFPGFGAGGAGSRGGGAGAGAGGRMGAGGAGGSFGGLASGNLLGLDGSESGEGTTGASSGGTYDMNAAGGGKGGGSGVDASSLFGSKDGAGGAGMVNVGKGAGDGKNGAGANRGLAGLDALKGSKGSGNGDGTTIFQMVRKRYTRLRSDGQI